MESHRWRYIFDVSRVWEGLVDEISTLGKWYLGAVLEVCYCGLVVAMMKGL